MVIKTLEEQMADVELNQAIQEAEEAQRQIDDAVELQAKARSLASLRKQKAQVDTIQAAETTLEIVSAQAEAQLARVQDAMSQWREDFARACFEIEQLVAELPPIEKEIFSTGFALRRAAEAVYYGRNPEKIGFNDEGTSDIPAEFAAAGGFETAWAQVGGNNPGLDAFQNLSGVAAELAGLIKKASKTTVYISKFGTKFFRHR